MKRVHFIGAALATLAGIFSGGTAASAIASGTVAPSSNPFLPGAGGGHSSLNGYAIQRARHKARCRRRSRR